MGNNHCKQLGIKPRRTISGKDFDRLWKKYDTKGQGRLDRKQAEKFLKNFAQAISEPFDKELAGKLFDECDVERLGWITYSQFKKLFLNFLTRSAPSTPINGSPVVSHSSYSEYTNASSMPSSPIGSPRVNLTNSLRLKLLSRPKLWSGDDLDFAESDDEKNQSDDDEKPAAYEEFQAVNNKGPKKQDSFEIFQNMVDADLCSGNADSDVIHTALSTNGKFEVVPKEEIDNIINNTLHEVANVLGMSTSNSALLLRIFDWDKDKLYSRYFDNPEKYNKEAGVSLETTENPPTNGTFECPVCMDDADYSSTHALSCGHRYCLDCWSHHLKSIANSQGSTMIYTSKCPYPKCGLIINRDDWKTLSDTQTYNKYCYFFNKSFIEGNPQLTYCPNDCGRAVKCTDRVRLNEIVECDCGKKFCFHCGLEYHNPVTCIQLREWNNKNEEDKDAASIKLITAISKPCPKCGIQVDRIDGCNHMTCQKCTHEWCWQCRGDWVNHGRNTGGFYYCNRYETSDAFKSDQEAKDLREEHNRYLHFYNGFFVNDKAESGSKSMKQEAITKSKQYQLFTGGDPGFLQEAVDTLIKCRHILKYTYIYGYFLPQSKSDDDPNALVKSMFEVQQALAQNMCEQLAKELLKPVNLLDRNKIVYKHKACKQYFNNLVNFFENEEEKERYSPKIEMKNKKRKPTKKGKEETQDARWICPRCTFSNNPSDPTCSLCEYDRLIETV